MFRPIAAIIRFSFESMVVVFYRIGGVVSVMCVILGCAAQVCLLAAVLCGSPTIVCPFLMSTAGGLCYPCEIPHVSNW